ncbi:MAG: aminotransferase class V-fold PLP-dependent enzyme [Firmicutes bacterium]|nr:aminotransferase class V-fold PLP-dependent enzyme [Bacillota bacterium]
MANFTDLIYGYTKKVPTKNGLKRYINFDNAASTPAFREVIALICREAQWYASIHRGTGYKSQYSTERYEAARQEIARFVGANPHHDTVIFTKNTTDAINKVSHYLPKLPGAIVVYTQVEHHSNELPWFPYPHHRIGLKGDEIDLGALEQFLSSAAGKVKLLAVCGASNVTGYVPPIHTLAEMAHRIGAKILVDGAQLIAHRPVHLYPPNHPWHLDFLAFSGHKMYAPFGVGVLIGPRRLFEGGPPSQVGGGTVKGVGPSEIIWNDPPDIEEAGSPNVLGALAVAEAARILTRLGWAQLIRHEDQLLKYALDQLSKIPGIIIYNQNHGLQDRVGVISFNLRGIHHYQLAKILADEWGIGVRNGCFCARGYVQKLLNLDPCQINSTRSPKTISGPLTPGMVRISFGCYNQIEEVDVLVKALREISQ